jgi:hypothetical protein
VAQTASLSEPYRNPISNFDLYSRHIIRIIALAERKVEGDRSTIEFIAQNRYTC